MASDIEIAVRNARRIETLLAERLGATGKGLHEKLSSVEKQLPPDILKPARWIATLRNSAVHEDGFVIQKADDFVNTAARIIAWLEARPLRAAPLPTGDGGQYGDLHWRLEPVRHVSQQPGEAFGESRRPRESRAPVRRQRRSSERSPWGFVGVGVMALAMAVLAIAMLRDGRLLRLFWG